VAAGLGLRIVLSGVLGTSFPYITLYPAVVFAAWFGGFGPGILATILSLVAIYLRAPSLGGVDESRTLLFLIAGSIFSILSDALRRARGRAERAGDLLHITLSSIGDAVISTDRAGRVRFLNSVAEELTGWKQAEAAGKAISEIFVIRNEKTGLPAEIPVTTVIRDGTVVTLANHTVLVRRDGLEIPIEDSAAPIRGSQKDVVGAVLVFRDVTERRRADEALKKSEERLKLALDAGQIGVWDWDLVQDRSEWTDRVYEIFGVERGKFGGRGEDFTELVHPEDRLRVDQAVRAALTDDVPYGLEFRVLHPRRGVIWISTSSLVYRNEKGEPIRMLGSVTDITERKHAEAQLLQQWRTFDTALSNTPDFTYVFDLEGHFSYINQALLSLLQRSYQDAVGKNFFELDYPPELAQRLQDQIQQVIDTKEPIKDQTPFTAPSGETGYYEYIFVPIFAEDGRVQAVAGSTRDVTERRRGEEELKRSNEELTRVNRELEEFAYVASHDLQEPLRMVNIYTQLILSEIGQQQKSEMGEYAGFVRQGVQRMEGLIHDLLTFSRAVHSDALPVGSADLSAAFKEAVSVLKNRIEESGAVITADALPTAHGDVSQIAHVFQNLLSNALKYRKRDVRPEIHVAARQDGSYWILSVRDNGIGFDPQYAERIFGLFKRLYNEEYPGTGLGLAICKRIVERYGGKIWAEGKTGEGATFYFSLPRAE
jgi:PAS domain S-box-containing protein